MTWTLLLGLLLAAFSPPGSTHHRPLVLPPPFLSVALGHEALAAGPRPGEFSGEVEEARVSEITLFLLGSGFALLIALLAWGEQIRNIAKDTRDLEESFLQARGLTRAEFVPILRPKQPSDQLVALTRLMGSGKLKTAPEVEVLGSFQQWSTIGARLARLLSLKYWLTAGLTIALLLTGGFSGVLDLRATPLKVTTRWSHFLPVLAVVGLTIGLLVAVIAAAHAEKKLNDVLLEISERV